MTNAPDNTQVDKDELIEKNTENSINFENFEEKKKKGFFSMLSNLMTSDKKTTEESVEIPRKKAKNEKNKDRSKSFFI